MSNVIEMKGICKSFGAVMALKNIDFAVRAGETMALVGENGAGKSTLMKVLTGVYTKDTGTILIGGEEVRKNNPVVAKHLGIAQVYQQFEMMDELSVTENIRGPQMGRIRLRMRPIAVHSELDNFLIIIVIWGWLFSSGCGIVCR